MGPKRSGRGRAQAAVSAVGRGYRIRQSDMERYLEQNRPQWQAFINANHGFAVGSGGTIRLFNGDAWLPQSAPLREPNWPAVLTEPRTKLHLYGKAEARIGRKMGHFTVRDADVDTALNRAREIKGRL